MSDVIPLSSPKPRRNRLAGDSLASDELTVSPPTTHPVRREPYQRSYAKSFSDVRLILRVFDNAMRAEGASREFRQRIANRLIWDGPDGVSE